MYKFNRLKVWLIAFTIASPVFALAQGPGGFDDDVLDNPVPFDGGVALLVAAGIGYGIKKVKEGRKVSSVNDDQ